MASKASAMHHLRGRQNSSTKQVDVERSPTQVGVIVGALLAFGLLSFLLYLLYRKRADSGANPLAWWRKPTEAADTASLKISGPMMTPPLPSEEPSTRRDLGDERANDSQTTLVPTAASKQSKPSIGQKIRQALFGASQSKDKQDISTGDMEKGQSSDSLEARPSNSGISHVSAEDWSQRQTSPTEVSIQTQSSMALHPAVTQHCEKLEKKHELRPGKSAFSWSTTAPTPIPPSRPNIRENPLPPLPHNRDSRRDTTLTTMSEDSQPVRHKSLSSWVANMQARQEKRERRLEGMAEEEDEGVVGLKLPSDENADGSTVRLSAMTDFSNMKTPALQTAQMAWHVHEMPGKVNVPSPQRSMTRGKNQGLGLQHQSHDDEGWVRISPDEEQGEMSQQEGESSREADHTQQAEYQQQDEYPQQGGEYLQDAAYSQQSVEQLEQEHLQQEEYAQPYEAQEEQEEYPIAYSEQPVGENHQASEHSQHYNGYQDQQQEQEGYPIQYDEQQEEGEYAQDYNPQYEEQQEQGEYAEQTEYDQEYNQEQQAEYPEQADYSPQYEQEQEQEQQGEYTEQAEYPDQADYCQEYDQGQEQAREYYEQTEQQEEAEYGIQEGDYGGQQYYDAEEDYPQQQQQ